MISDNFLKKQVKGLNFNTKIQIIKSEKIPFTN